MKKNPSNIGSHNSPPPLADHAELQEHIFSTGQEHYKALLGDIAQAKESIDFESYIFSNDQAGQAIADGLIAALRRGVHVRVLVDGFGSPFWGTGLSIDLEKAGAKTKIYNPFPWQVWNWQRSTRRHWLISKWAYLALNINTRNHRKTAIIDKRIAYVGSFNVHRCHLPKDKGGSAWRDTSVRLSGVNLNTLIEAFENTWNHQPIRERVRDAFVHFKLNPRFRLNTTRHSRRILFKNLIKRVRSSQERVWITCAYFVPNNTLLRRLNDASKRNVDVRLLLPKKSDVFVVDWATLTFYKKLLNAKVRIFEYKPSVMHAKSLIIDTWMVVGSTNLNSRSLVHDLEADVELHTAQAKEDLYNLYLTDLLDSREITLENWGKQLPLYKRVLGKFVIYFRYWF